MARGTVAVKFVGDVKGLQDAVGKADNSLGSFGAKVNSGIGTMVKFGAAAVAAGTVAAGAFGVKAVMAASDLNEQLSKVGVVFGDSAAQVTKFANQMAKDFGLPKTVILDAAGGIGLVGKASGLAQADAAKLGTNMAKLAADASSFYNVPLEEALATIKSGLVGEAEPLRRFGVLLSEAAVQEEAVALGIAKVGEKLTEQQKVQARSSLIMKGMTDASGDLERTQDGLANRIRELKGRAENFAATVGTALLPLVLKALDVFEKLGAVIGDRLAPVFAGVAKLFRNFGETIKGTGDKSRGFMIDIAGMFGVLEDNETLGVLMDLFDKFSEVVGKVGSFIADNLTPVLAALGGVVGTVLVASVYSLVTAFVALFSPAVLIVGAIAAVVAGVVDAYKNFEGFRNVVNAVASFLADKVIPAFIATGGAVVKYLGDAVAWVQRMWPQISEAIGHVMRVVGEIVGRYLAVVSFLWRHAGDDIFNLVKRVFHAIYGVINGVLDAVRGLIQTVLAVINGDWSKAWNGLLAVQQGIWDAIYAGIAGALGAVRSLFAGLGGIILGAISNVGGMLFGAGRSMIDGLINGIGSMGGALARFVTDFIKRNTVDKVKGALGISSPSRVFAEIGSNIVAGLNQGTSAAAVAPIGVPSLSGPEVDLGPRFGAGPARSAGVAGASATTVHLTVEVPNYLGGDLPRDVVDRIVAALSRHLGAGGTIGNGRGGAVVVS